MLQITRRIEYALRAAVHLARLPEGTRVSYKDVAEREDIPRDFVAKILRSLVDAGLAESTRGPGGGFSLARSPETITFLDVIEAAEGPIALNRCCEAGEGCERSGDCSLESVWRRGERAMVDVFRSTSIAQVAGVAQPTPSPASPPQTQPIPTAPSTGRICMVPAQVAEMIES